MHRYTSDTGEVTTGWIPPLTKHPTQGQRGVTERSPGGHQTFDTSQYTPNSWLTSLEDTFKKHAQNLRNGLQKCKINFTINNVPDVDCHMITWIFKDLEMGDTIQLQRFAAMIARARVGELMTAIKSEKMVLYGPLHTLL